MLFFWGKICTWEHFLRKSLILFLLSEESPGVLLSTTVWEPLYSIRRGCNQTHLKACEVCSFITTRGLHRPPLVLVDLPPLSLLSLLSFSGCISQSRCCGSVHRADEAVQLRASSTLCSPPVQQDSADGADLISPGVNFCATPTFFLSLLDLSHLPSFPPPHRAAEVETMPPLGIWDL